MQSQFVQFILFLFFIQVMLGERNWTQNLECRNKYSELLELHALLQFEYNLLNLNLLLISHMDFIHYIGNKIILNVGIEWLNLYPAWEAKGTD